MPYSSRYYHKKKNFKIKSITTKLLFFFKQAKWASQFPIYATQERDFYAPKNKNITLQMMYQADKFKYGDSEKLDATVKLLVYLDNSS